MTLRMQSKIMVLHSFYDMVELLSSTLYTCLVLADISVFPPPLLLPPVLFVSATRPFQIQDVFNLDSEGSDDTTTLIDKKVILRPTKGFLCCS